MGVEPTTFRSQVQSVTNWAMEGLQVWQWELNLQPFNHKSKVLPATQWKACKSDNGSWTYNLSITSPKCYQLRNGRLASLTMGVEPTTFQSQVQSVTNWAMEGLQVWQWELNLQPLDHKSKVLPTEQWKACKSDNGSWTYNLSITSQKCYQLRNGRLASLTMGVEPTTFQSQVQSVISYAMEGLQVWQWELNLQPFNHKSKVLPTEQWKACKSDNGSWTYNLSITSPKCYQLRNGRLASLTMGVEPTTFQSQVQSVISYAMEGLQVWQWELNLQPFNHKSKVLPTEQWKACKSDNGSWTYNLSITSPKCYQLRNGRLASLTMGVEPTTFQSQVQSVISYAMEGLQVWQWELNRQPFNHKFKSVISYAMEGLQVWQWELNL